MKSKFNYILLGLGILILHWFSSCLVEPEEKTIYRLKNASGKDVTVRLFFKKQLQEPQIFSIKYRTEIDDSTEKNILYLHPNNRYHEIDSVQIRFEDGVTIGFIPPYDITNVQPYNIMIFNEYNHEHIKEETYRYTYIFKPEMYYYYKKHGYYTEE